MEPTAPEQESSDDRVLVEVFTMAHDHTPAEEMVLAIARGKWRDLVEVRVDRAGTRGVTETPYGVFDTNTIVVGEKHVVRGADYWGLVQALEECCPSEDC
jgi:hypothetical protein